MAVWVLIVGWLLARFGRRLGRRLAPHGKRSRSRSMTSADAPASDGRQA